MLKKIEAVNQGKSIGLKNIIHIGDDPKADIAGADSIGIKGYLVNSNNVSILSLNNLC